MTAKEASPEFPGLFPAPRDMQWLEGTTELSPDVRLMTSDVLPLQRKAMRGVLTDAGVRVVANKKKFIIEVRVVAPSELETTGVPAAALAEYYELELRSNRVYIRTASQAGALWGIHALAGIYRSAAMGAEVPNLLVRDWPDLLYRGIFVENKWGPDRMDLSDWYKLVDRLAALRLNVLGIGLYGCWGACRYEGQPTEFLMVPVPDHPELQTEKHLRWYSPGAEAWQDETYLPFLFAEDLLGQIVAYGSEKGVTVVPFVNSLGHNTLIPRLFPAVSATAPDGTPSGSGYCLSAPETRDFIEAFYGSVLDRYFPDGAPFFHIQLDEVWPDFADPADPARSVDPWCQCGECRKRAREENLRDYIVWLVKMLVDKGVGRVVMWNDQLTRHMKLLDAAFVKALRAAGVADRLVLHWWWYSNEALNDQTRVSLGTKLGLPGWVGPMTCYFNWQGYSPRLTNIELMLRMAREEGAEGAVSYAVHDVGWSDHEALLAAYAWNHDAAGPPDAALAAWAAGRYKADAERFLAATGALRDVVASCPALGHCYQYTYTYCRPDTPFPRAYPGEALGTLADMGLAKARAQLLDAAARARKAGETFAELGGTPDLRDDEVAGAKSLHAEAARIDGLATAFAFLTEAWEAAAAGTVGRPLVSAGATARLSLLDAMRVIEANKPDYTVPATLQALSVLLAFLEQLRGDLEAVLAGSLAPAAVRWTLPGA